MAHDIAGMEAKLHSIESKIATLNEGRYPRQLTAIIRRPGFTTVAEAMLIHSTLDQVQHQLEALQQSCEGLLAAAGKVGAAGAGG
jgi:hypothetical protein